ncbi:hypothetical protein [Deinococcus aluminii]|uniref:Uncharacterized protein n=1 Tax=Deinococcus aluminii TaxID=1656885 RepID=A0ABP9XET1_9DEIO
MSMLLKLACLLTPTFRVTEERPPLLGEQNALCMEHTRGQGYHVYETRGGHVLPETFEDGLTREEMLELVRQSGARPETLRAVMRKRSVTLPAPPELALHVHTQDGTQVFRVDTHGSRGSFLRTVRPTVDASAHDPVLALSGWAGEGEVAWQDLFDLVPWGAGTVGALQRLHPNF